MSDKIHRENSHTMDEGSYLYILDELSHDERRRFEAEMQENSLLRARVYDARTLVDKLRSAQDQPIARNIEKDVLREIAEIEHHNEGGARAKEPWFLRPALKIAASLALLLGLGFVVGPLFRTSPRPAAPIAAPLLQNNPTEEAIAQAMDWIIGAQDETGSWDPSPWGGQRQYTAGTTGLALLALVGGDQSSISPQHASAVTYGVRYLLNAQDETTGLIGKRVQSAMYNHAIATLALLEVYSHQQDEQLKVAIDGALAYIQDTQSDAGGWGYGLTKAERPNSSISAWPMLALHKAERLGWSGVADIRAKGIAWFRTMVGPDGRTGYQSPADFPHGSETLIAIGATMLFGTPHEAVSLQQIDGLMRNEAQPDAGQGLDFYRAFFLSSALNSTNAPSAGEHLAAVRSELLSAQETQGELAGSWNLSDQWSSVGGRVYTTAMAALALM